VLKFFDIDDKYINYLRIIEAKIPNISSSANSKFVCGIVLNIKGIDYYAPISSNPTVYKSSFPILDKKQNVIATIRFSFMFPAESHVLTEKNFKEVAKINKFYADLLEEEYRYCVSKQLEIYEIALKIYKIGCNKKHYLNEQMNDFKLLEENYKEYKK